jgi:hypothetical protein
MLVKCKNIYLVRQDGPYYFLSITKEQNYEVLDVAHLSKIRSVVVYGSDISYGEFYQIKDNSGHVAYYPSELFITISETRDIKINSILR